MGQTVIIILISTLLTFLITKPGHSEFESNSIYSQSDNDHELSKEIMKNIVVNDGGRRIYFDSEGNGYELNIKPDFSGYLEY